MALLLRHSALRKQALKLTCSRSLVTSFKAQAYQRQILTEEQVLHYKHTSYVVVENLLTPQEKEYAIECMGEILQWAGTSQEPLVYNELINKKQVITRLERFYKCHDKIARIIDGKLSQAVADLLEEPACVFKDKINFKFPGGMGYDAHQDGAAYTMMDWTNHNFHITCMLSADPMTVENGCLFIAPGKYEPGDGFIAQKHGYISDELVDTFDWKSIACDAGTVILFNSLVPHKSERNTTGQARRAYYITYNGISNGDKREEYYSMKRQMYPPDAERDPEKDYSEGEELFTEKEITLGRMGLK